jgi:sugar transferase (PEP-CTERM/EpsH1 system associated)
MTEILFLAHRAPWPPDRGDRIRSWHLFEALARLAPVHVAALCDNDADAAVAREKLLPLAASVHLQVRRRSRPAAMLHALARREPASAAMFANRQLGRHVSGLLRHGNITHIVGFSSQMGQYIPPRTHFSGPVVMDFVDVDSAKFAAYAEQDQRQPMHWVNAREGRLLAAYEAALAHRVDASLFVSKAEAALFRARSGMAADLVHGIGNGIDTDRFDPAGDFAPLLPREEPLLTFTGQMDYRPNIDAVNWFARDILPLVRRQHPGAAFAIVGRAPTREVLALAELPGVEVTGEVPDVRPWLAASDVVVAPLLLARGIQNKLLEAMAMACPVVASPAAAEGIEADHNRHLHVASDGPAMADAIGALLNDRDRAADMGAAARQQMLVRYGWAARLAPLAGLLGIGG